MRIPEIFSTGSPDHLLLTRETTSVLFPDAVPVLAGRTPEQLRGLAVLVATSAADHVRRARRDTVGVDGRVRVAQTKSSAVDPVTAVDRSSEALLRELINRYAPGDSILGEENGGRLVDDAVTWIVDPIDGTVNFVYGIPASAVSVAATVMGVPVAAAVVDIAGDRVYSASIGGPAFCGRGGDGAAASEEDTNAGRVLRVEKGPMSLSLALVGTGFAYDSHRRAQQASLLVELLPQIRDIRRMGSAALDLCAVAAGKLDAYYEHGLGPWDHAGGALVAARAGAEVHMPRLTAGSAEGVGVLAAAPAIAAELAVHTTSVSMPHGA